jgi:type IV pilus assembly protein PilO
MPLRSRNAIIPAVTCTAVFGFTLYAWWTFFYANIHNKIVATQSQIHDLTKRRDAYMARAQQLSQLEAEMASLSVEVAALEKQLPKDRELPSLLRVLTHRAEAYGLILSSLTPGRAVTKGLYDEIPYNISAVSSFHGLGHFLTAMGKGDRLFAARNLALQPGSVKTDPSKTVNATFILVAFQYHG